MKRVYRLIGLLIGLVATVAFVAYSVNTLTIEDLSLYITTPVLVGIVIAALLYATIIPVSAWAWRGMLADVGTTKSWRELVMIMAITQMAKYLPGNIGHHIGRAGMSLARGISIRPFFLTVFMETLLALFAALVIGLMGAVYSRSGLATLKLGNELAIVLMLAGLVILGLLIYRPFVSQLLRRFAPNYINLTQDTLLPLTPTLLKAFSAFSLNYVMIGVGLWLMASTILPEMEHDFMLLLSSFALAWVVGFFTPGAPAGLGVREAIMLGILSTSYPGSSGLFIIISLRLATILGDSLCFLIGYTMLLSQRRGAYLLGDK